MSVLERRTRIAFPFTVAGSTLVLREVSTTHTLNIPAGTYWSYVGPALGSRDSLFDEITTLIGATAASGTYVFEAGVPTESPGEGNIRRGLTIKRTAGSGSWGIDWSSSTLDPRYLGYPESHATDVATTADFITAPRELLGAWIPFRHRSMDPRNPRREIAESGGEVARDNFHQTDYGLIDDRVMVFAHQPAAAVRKGKGTTYLGVANLGDDNGCFERLWEVASQRKELIVFYDMDPVTIEAADGPTHEVLKLKSDAQNFEKNLRMMNAGGEFYELELFFGVVSGNRDD